MGYEVLKSVGEFGIYQKLLCGIFVFYTTFLCGINYYTQVFILDTPQHRCSDPLLDAHNSDPGVDWEVMLPWLPKINNIPSKCSQYEFSEDPHTFANLSHLYFTNIPNTEKEPHSFSGMKASLERYYAQTTVKSCDAGWTYDHSLVFPTITSQNDWVCEEDWRPLVIHTLFWVGNTLGCFIWGFTNDKFGRKPTVLITHSIYFLAGIATLFVPNFPLLAACRFLVGCAHHTVSHLPYLLVLEYCGVSSRTVPLLMVMVSYSLASMSVPWVAWLLPSWQYLAVIAPTAVLPVLFCAKWIPESPSWLIVMGKEERAIKELTRVARINGKEVQEDVWKHELFNEKEKEANENEPKEKVNLFSIVKTPNLRVNAFLVNVICMMGFMCYYGHVQNTSNLGEGNIYKSYFLGALVEIPCWSIPFLINKLGRRWPLFTLFFSSGVCGVIYGYIPPHWTVVSLFVALLGRMTVTAAYFISLQYGSEIFPTVIRGQGVAMCEIFGSVAIFVSPSIVYLNRVSPYLPLFILGLCSLVGALATFFLPETAGRALPHTLEEARHFGRDQSLCSCSRVKESNPDLELEQLREKESANTV